MAWTNDQTWALVNKPEPEEIRLVDLLNKPEPDELMHFGILGMKWGKRRYQNADGSLTPEGKERYGHDNDNNDNNDNKDLRERFEKAKEEDPETFKKVAGGDIDFDDLDDPELTELILMDYEDYKSNKRVDELDRIAKLTSERANKKSADDFIKAVRNTTISGKQVKDLMNKKRMEYEDIYNEMMDEYKEFEKLLVSEDPDDYREAESVWYLIHKDDKK